MDAGGVTCVWRGCWTPTCQWSPTYPTWHISHKTATYPTWHTDTPITTIFLTRQQPLPILPEKEATTKFNCQRGLFQGDFYPQQPLTGRVDLALLATPPPIKKVPALAGDKKRAHPFLPDVFLYKRTITAANVP